MLVLTRKKNQSIYVGDYVKFILLEVGGSRARIGVEAPDEYAIHRAEVFDKILAEGRQVVQRQFAQEKQHPLWPSFYAWCRGQVNRTIDTDIEASWRPWWECYIAGVTSTKGHSYA